MESEIPFCLVYITKVKFAGGRVILFKQLLKD